MIIQTVKGRHSELLTIDGVHIGQTPKTKDYIELLLPGFKNIIEIGTHIGGFTLLISQLMDEDANLTTFDTNESRIDEKVKNNKRINVVISDCFKCTDKIKELIQKNGRSIILCDGGNKTKEFKTFCEFLKSDDVIMLHDFLHDKKSWNNYTKEAKWKFSNETTRAKIEDSIKKHNLKNHPMYDDLCKSFWGTFLK